MKANLLFLLILTLLGCSAEVSTAVNKTEAPLDVFDAILNEQFIHEHFDESTHYTFMRTLSEDRITYSINYEIDPSDTGDPLSHAHVVIVVASAGTLITEAEYQEKKEWFFVDSCGELGFEV